tara:strand:- start:190 stop:1104 length:915 start_codon:yes stop_codon:yes gene_type:complete
MESLYGQTGGRKSKFTDQMPSEREGMGLAVGAALLFCKLRDASCQAFWCKISDEVVRCMESDRTFSKDVMKRFVVDKLFGGIPQYAIETWIQHACLLLTGEDLIAWKKETVENFMYRYLGSSNAGVDYADALELCRQANVEAILQCKQLGGRPEWKLEDFLSNDIWINLGGKAGVKKAAKQLLTVVAAAGSSTGSIDPFCRTCKQLKFEHRGRRTEIVPIRCACDKPKPAEEVDVEAMRAAKLQKTAQKSRTGNMAALDPTGQGTKESFARKVLPTASNPRSNLHSSLPTSAQESTCIVPPAPV